MKKEIVQNFKNHSKMAPKIYYISILLALVGFIMAMSYCKNLITGGSGMLLPAVISALCFSVVFIGWFSRAFALKAQDRAIRAEENLRHFAFAGKLLDSRLSISQVIALRFASDEEFIELAKKAANEKLSNKQIKELIKNWRGDHYRV